MGEAVVVEKWLGRRLTAGDLEMIRDAVRTARPPLRAEIARRVCEALQWRDAQGKPKLMSCRVGLLRLHRAGLIEMPAPRNGNGNGRGLVRQPTEWPDPEPVTCAVGALSGLRLKAVSGKPASRLYNGLIDRWGKNGDRPRFPRFTESRSC